MNSDDPQIELTESARMGVEPEHLIRAMGTEAFNLPVAVRLGRIKPHARPQACALGHYLDETVAAGSLPASTNYRAKAAASLSRMYLNDRYGCCVVAGRAHGFGVWTGNDTPNVALATDQEILSQYQQWCGPGDRGCNISSVLNILKTRGMLMNGVLHKLEGYVAADWTNPLQAKTVLYLSGAACIGFDLPQAWTSSAVWDVTTSRTVGGHDVTPIDYDEKGVYVSSWGRIYLMTWAAFNSRTWISEFYMLLGKDWWNDDQLAPNGIDVKTLRDDLAKIGGGQIPPIDPPPPPPPPPVAGEFVIASQTVDAAGKWKIVLAQG